MFRKSLEILDSLLISHIAILLADNRSTIVMFSVRWYGVSKQPSSQLMKQKLSRRFRLLLEGFTRTKSNRKLQNGLKIYLPTLRQEFQPPSQYASTVRLF